MVRLRGSWIASAPDEPLTGAMRMVRPRSDMVGSTRCRSVRERESMRSWKGRQSSGTERSNSSRARPKRASSSRALGAGSPGNQGSSWFQPRMKTAACISVSGSREPKPAPRPRSSAAAAASRSSFQASTPKRTRAPRCHDSRSVRSSMASRFMATATAIGGCGGAFASRASTSRRWATPNPMPAGAAPTSKWAGRAVERRWAISWMAAARRGARSASISSSPEVSAASGGRSTEKRSSRRQTSISSSGSRRSAAAAASRAWASSRARRRSATSAAAWAGRV
jgi:hypothetical protein